MNYQHDEDGATRTLHAIQAGGQQLLIIARRRIGELLDNIDSGDFDAAYGTARLVLEALNPLMNAQHSIAIAEDATMVPARELRAGYLLSGVGEISEIEVNDCPAEQCKGHVKLKIGEHEVSYEGDVELYVATDSLEQHG